MFLFSTNPCVVSDDGGRYTYEKQPSICKWNCMKLGEALHPMISTETTKPVLDELFDSEFEKCYLEKMKKKVNIALVVCIDVRFKIVVHGSPPPSHSPTHLSQVSTDDNVST